MAIPAKKFNPEDLLKALHRTVEEITPYAKTCAEKIPDDATDDVKNSIEQRKLNAVTLAKSFVMMTLNSACAVCAAMAERKRKERQDKKRKREEEAKAIHELDSLLE